MPENKLSHYGLFVMRVILGAVFFYYGSRHLLMLFGGQGFNSTLDWMERRYHIPPAFAALAIFAEFFGGLGVLVGLLTRLAAFGIAATMAVATYVNFAQLDLYDETTVQQFGLPLVLFGMSVLLITTGGGKISLDWKLSHRKKKGEAA
ncbi:MAG: DoxX family protein [Fimbriimonadaceae bacterium]|nr:DoxX family protein [Fimbriimonadaceae bacterium]